MPDDVVLYKSEVSLELFASLLFKVASGSPSSSLGAESVIMSSQLSLETKLSASSSSATSCVVATSLTS